jgi:hypothetical protein
MRFRGGLTGGGSGGATGCGDYKEGDFYFRLDRAWNQVSTFSKQLKHWLDPVTPDNAPTTTLQLDGLDPYGADPAIRLCNLQKTDTLEKVTLPGGWGSPFGHNNLQTPFFAERFRAQDSCVVLGTYLIAAKGTNNSAKPVYVIVYSGGETPGDVLGKALLNPNYIDYVERSNTFVTRSKTYFTNKENFVKFSKPVSVGKEFYIGYEINYPVTAAEDSFYVYAAVRADSLNTAFFKQNGVWHPYTDHPNKPMCTSLWIEPVVAGDTTYSKIDTGTVISALRPNVAWSDATSSLIIAFPSQWTGATMAEVFDLSGKIVSRAVLNPPFGTIYFADKSPRLLLIRLNNGKTVATQKAPIGFE